MSNGMRFTQIGSEGGYLPQPVRLKQLLIAPAERADVIVDFSKVKRGTRIVLQNVGPDEPYGGGAMFKDFEPSDPDTTGQVMQFRVKARKSADTSLPAAALNLPAIARFGRASNVRNVSLNELSSSSVKFGVDAGGNVVLDSLGQPFAPQSAALGTWTAKDGPQPLRWMDDVTENPAVGALETWNIRNFTMDAHPIHIHLVQFQVVKRVVTDPSDSPHGALGEGAIIKPEAWETGFKDTVIVYPGEYTQIKARFDRAGLFVWHCHILEHEDNEMMRPYRVGPAPLSSVTTQMQ
jgi:bilirubin oxidase